MLLGITIFLIFLAIQFVFAFYGLLVRHKIEHRYNYPLGEQIEAAAVLEAYSRLHRKVDLRVDAGINLPAYAEHEFLLVNKDKMYQFDLFTTFYTIYQLELSRKKNSFQRNLYKFQNILFGLHILVFLIGIILQQYSWAEYIMYAAIAIQLFSILFSIIGFLLYEYILKDAFAIAFDMLNFDEVEYIRAEKLRDELKYHVFEYPIDVASRFIGFFIPNFLK